MYQIPYEMTEVLLLKQHVKTSKIYLQYGKFSYMDTLPKKQIYPSQSNKPHKDLTQGE